MEANIDTDKLRKNLSPIMALVDDIHFNFDDRGLHIKQLDLIGVSMILLDIEPGEFNTYKCMKKCEFNIDSNELKTILDMVYTDNVSLRVEEDQFRVDFNGGMGKCAIWYGKGILQKELNIDFTARAVVNTEKFKDHLDKFERISKLFTINLSEKRSYFEINKDVELEIPFSRVGRVEKINEPVKVLFATEMMLIPFTPEILKSVKSVTLHLRSDAPIKMEFPIDGKNLVYYLAPRVC